MIEKKDLLSPGFYKSSPFTGSFQGMRYRICRQEEELEVVIWPEPYNFASTAEEEKQAKRVPFTEDGLSAAAAWLNEQYLAQQDRWRNAVFFIDAK